ncbi:MAG: 50S ribosomal protein L23 [Oligoflexia bacterium]|nr:50S ribosomal protein L23 [Oligoflexia bacterium]
MAFPLRYIVLKPLLTEKSTNALDNCNRYAFRVAIEANKNVIKSAIEKLFDVKVIDVKTATLPGKVKRTKKGVFKTKKFKKAYVKIKEGQKIEFFKGI